MQLPLEDPSFSLSSPHFKEGQWRSKGPSDAPALASSFCHTAAGCPHAGDTGAAFPALLMDQS